MQSENTPRLPTYSEATRPEINHSYLHSGPYPAYLNPIPYASEPNYAPPPSVPLYQYTNNQLPTHTAAAQHIHIITEARPQSRSFGCTKRQGLIWGFIFGLLIFAGICRVIISHYNRRY